jgi:hypothetical protein
MGSGQSCQPNRRTKLHNQEDLQTLVFSRLANRLVTDEELRYVLEAKRTAPSEATHVGSSFGGHHPSIFQTSRRWSREPWRQQTLETR